MPPPPDAPQALIAPNALLLAQMNSIYNQLLSGTDLKLPTKRFNIKLDFGGGLTSSVPANIYWVHLGETMRLKLEGGDAYVWIPSLDQLQLTLEKEDPAGVNPKKIVLANLMDRLVTAAGGPPHPLVQASTTPHAERNWQAEAQAFAQWFENHALTAFERAKAAHEEGVHLALECAADMIVRKDVGEQLIYRLTRARLDTQAQGPSRLPQLAKLLQRIFLELQVYQRFAQAAGWAKEVTPDSPIWAFLPAENRPGVRGGAAGAPGQQAVAEGEPAAQQEPQAAEPDDRPVLHFEDIDAGEGFVRVAPEDELLQHPRFRFYMEELHCQNVVRASQWKKKTVAFLFVTKKGTRIAFVDSCHEGHAACYVFRCGTRNDAPETRKRWAAQAQLPRRRVRQEGAAVADTLIGSAIRHGQKGGWKKTIKKILETE